MEPFVLITQNFWVIVILFTSINFFFFKDKGKCFIQERL